MASLLAACTGRRAKWVVLALWVLAVGVASSAQLPSKFADAGQNRATSFLPGDAESSARSLPCWPCRGCPESRPSGSTSARRPRAGRSGPAARGRARAQALLSRGVRAHPEDPRGGRHRRRPGHDRRWRDRDPPGLPLYAFIFLVALGIDYNVFLMARVREEAAGHGTSEGMLRGLAVTGADLRARFADLVAVEPGYSTGR